MHIIIYHIPVIIYNHINIYVYVYQLKDPGLVLTIPFKKNRTYRGTNRVVEERELNIFRERAAF